ncbi:MAG: DEAD/DEAH box helicase [Bacilli bacterium]|jgi:ATP-dependent RNA helicase RhlE|nr:DEAD/DEAH box helicase [Bacilli bacterium]
MTFNDFNFTNSILKAVEKEGYSIPTEIQAEAIPLILAENNILASAQTGTGKTAAFALPLLELIQAKVKDYRQSKVIRALVLSPTRELANQISDTFITLGAFLPLKTAVVFGGEPAFRQKKKLQNGVDILVATPGRLLDFVNQGVIDLQNVEHFVIDEVDQMMDMGFIRDVKKIAHLLPKQRQTLMFSATIPPEIENLANELSSSLKRISIAPVTETLDNITQKLIYVSKQNKSTLLVKLLADPTITSLLVFTRTKRGANKVASILEGQNISVELLHGNKSQKARTIALARFKNHQVRVLVATDIAARGIDIDHLSHVLNYDLPEFPDTYIHRMGRTGRAGFTGTSLSFCSKEELTLLKAIQKHIDQKIPVDTNYGFNDVYESLPEAKIEKKTDDDKEKNSSRTGSRKRGKDYSFNNRSRNGFQRDSFKAKKTQKRFDETDANNIETSEKIEKEFSPRKRNHSDFQRDSFKTKRTQRKFSETDTGADTNEKRKKNFSLKNRSRSGFNHDRSKSSEAPRKFTQNGFEERSDDFDGKRRDFSYKNRQENPSRRSYHKSERLSRGSSAEPRTFNSRNDNGLENKRYGNDRPQRRFKSGNNFKSADGASYRERHNSNEDKPYNKRSSSFKGKRFSSSSSRQSDQASRGTHSSYRSSKPSGRYNKDKR